jgi:molybdopterin-binding protein
MQRWKSSFPSRLRRPTMRPFRHHRIVRTMSITAINVRNQFRGRVKEIIDGPVVSEVDVETASGQIVTSVITTRSVKELELAPGREVVALVKSTEVSIATL